ncbi:MAG: aspartate ammonia-lyase [Candidatus Cloacimonetes bacterium]|nr:aspartate ammonia-lyase [Candidatus Cloacimonadota bacterium]
MRKEKDEYGEVQLADTELFGIQSVRARENFAVSGEKMPPVFIKALAEVKWACAETNMKLGFLDKGKGAAIVTACEKLASGEYDSQIIVDAFQGGAGTSTNMNINEVVANLALLELQEEPGNYEIIHPLRDVNMHQSTNDVYPSALRVAVLYKLKELEEVIGEMQSSLQEKELEFRDVVKLGRTQLQDAVPMTLGMEFSAWAEAISRDRWRIFKSRERIKQLNLGGTAIGTGLAAPREYIFRVVEQLRKVTGLSIARAENLVDATQNLDPFVEISGMLKALAVNLFKISQDLRILSSGPYGGIGEINLPALQKGSSIMPGKVNPVIPEMTAQVSLQVMNNDNLITQIAALGNLELNQFLPLLAHTILQSLELLIKTIPLLVHKCLRGITANSEHCLNLVKQSRSLAAVLIPRFGYEKIEELLHEVDITEKSLAELLLEKGLLNEEQISEILSPQQMYKQGF